MERIRQPIVTVAGHVDHGKTSILDAIRETCVAEKEPGLITQKISYSILTKESIEKLCKELLERFKIEIVVPGFVFIDTPGHAAFTNLRQRGGNVADLAILVIDINEGIKEQTRETIEILRQNKLPFVVALNKIDKISGWKPGNFVFQNIKNQQEFTRKEFFDKVTNIITALSLLGFDAELYWEIKDFTKKIALIPCSAKTKEGIAEILAIISGLAQKFLINKLKLGKEIKGNILEVIKEKGFTYYDCILYDGVLEEKDYLLIASFGKTILTKIRAMFEWPKFKKTKKVFAATGFRVSLATEEEIFAGMPFIGLKEDQLSDIGLIEKKKQELNTTIQNILKLDKKGVVVKAESLGSLEALIGLLKKNGILVGRAGIGDINKKDISYASTNLAEDPLNAAILGFNVKAEVTSEEIKIICSNIIYKLIEEFFAWREEKEKEIERKKLEALTFPCKIKILKNCIFRRSKPAICGVKVLAGMLKKGIGLMKVDGKSVGEVKSIQKENKPIDHAIKNDEVAISISDVTIGRNVKEEDVLYSDLSEDDYKKLKANKEVLTSDELEILQEILEIKRKIKPTWGI
jgi:translation initiation factor 5B